MTQVFCHKQSFFYLQFYLYCIGKIVNKQRIVFDRIPGSRYSTKAGLYVHVIIDHIRAKVTNDWCIMSLVSVVSISSFLGSSMAE